MRDMRLLSLLAGLFLLAPLASYGQASRTWVSGTGDDANPASRTAPCKTFAGAISRTAANGEINVIDAGGFGAVTITKSITIDGTGAEAGILAAGVNGIIIQGQATPIVVALRHLSLNGFGTGLIGIRVVGGAAIVRVEDCRIFGFTGAAISFESVDNTSSLYVEDCKISSCAGGGILMKPGTTGSPAVQTVATFLATHTSISECGVSGVDNGVGTTGCLSDVKCSGITGPAITSGKATSLTVTNCTATLCSKGVVAGGNLYLSDSDVVANLGAGLSVTTGVIYSPRNNRVAGNSPDGAPGGTATLR